MSRWPPGSPSTTLQRVRESRGSALRQVAHWQPITGIPCEVPVPRNRSSRDNSVKSGKVGWEAADGCKIRLSGQTLFVPCLPRIRQGPASLGALLGALRHGGARRYAILAAA